jgi:protein-tyrosine phosphatase
MALLSEPRTAHQALGDGKGAAMFLGQYRAFVALETSRQAYGRLFADLIDPSRRPALIHCQGGKDRTGWAAAALLLLLGVPMAAVVDDYVASNAHLRPGFERFFADFEARGGDARLLTELFGVRRDYLEASLLEMRERFGTVERYVAEGLELGDAGVAALREAFLE